MTIKDVENYTESEIDNVKYRATWFKLSFCAIFVRPRGWTALARKWQRGSSSAHPLLVPQCTTLLFTAISCIFNWAVFTVSLRPPWFVTSPPIILEPQQRLLRSFLRYLTTFPTCIEEHKTSHKVNGEYLRATLQPSKAVQVQEVYWWSRRRHITITFWRLYNILTPHCACNYCSLPSLLLLLLLYRAHS